MRVLNLGCGIAKIPGAINVDNRAIVEPDIVLDLNIFPYPWGDGVFDKIIMSHILEHLDNASRVLIECNRLLKWNGVVEISVPHCSHDLALGDRFHKRIVNDYTLVGGSVVSGEDIEEMRVSSLRITKTITKFDTGFKWMLYMPKWVKHFAIYHLRNVARESSYVLQKQAKFATITFDDGPSEYTPAVLDKLQELKIKAVFFVLGVNAEKYPGIIKRIVNEGHELGIHGYDHSKWVSKDIVQSEVQKTKDILVAIVPDYKIEYFRPPFLKDYASKFHRLLNVPALKGMCSVDYSSICDDWKKETTLGKMLVLTKGFIRLAQVTILFHDGYYSESNYKDRSKASEALLPTFIYLINKGYSVVNLKGLEETDGKIDRATTVPKVG